MAGRKPLPARTAISIRFDNRLLPQMRAAAKQANVSLNEWLNLRVSEILEIDMGHRCGANCKRKQGIACTTCRHGGGSTARRPHATPQQVGAAVDMYYDGLSYRRTAENVGSYFGRPTGAASVYRWCRDLARKAGAAASDYRLPTGDEWVADEIAVKVGGKQYWIFNVMDADSRVLLAAYLSPERTTRAAATAMAMARERAAKPPKTIKTDGLRSYRQGIDTAFRNYEVKHIVSQGIRAQINNNLSERLQGTLRDRDRTLRGLKQRGSGQEYIDGLVVHYNYFRPHGALDGKTPAQAAGADMPFSSWQDVAEMENYPAK